MPEEFLYTLASYATFAANGVTPAAVEFAVTVSHPRVWTWIDDRTVKILARDQAGDLLLAVAIEGDGPYENAFIVVSALYPDLGDLPEGQ